MVLALVSIAAIVWGSWRFIRFLDGYVFSPLPWLFAPFMIAAAAGVLAIGPRRDVPRRDVARIDPSDPGSPRAASSPTTEVNPWALAWFILLSVAAGAAQAVATFV